jgi:acyl-CoA synthetase (AMP-forming)/AMP-acid ligase II
MTSQSGVNVPAAVFAKAAQIPEHIAVVDGSERISYAALAERVGDTARALLAAGIEPGDRVALWAPNSARWIVAALAVQSVGAAFVPINTRYKPAEAAYPLSFTRAKLLFVANGFMGLDGDAVVPLAAQSDDHAIQVVDIHASDHGAASWASFLAAGQSVPESRWRAILGEVGADDVCDIMFTSGSSGRPKAVPHQHGPTLRQTRNTISENGNTADDRYLIVNPFFHVFGYTGGWLPALLVGATVYPVPTFDVDAVLQLIESERITYFPGPPTIFHSLLEHPRLREFDVSSLRLSLTGAADVPVELIQRMLDELTFERVIQAYGMTECGTATYTPPEADAETVAATIGVACDGLEVRVVDSSNQPLPPEEPGEIVVRGYAVMTGYLDNPQANAAAIDAEGWLHTGDRGVCDARGYFRILGRIGDMIIVGGFNVYPAEVEELLRQHPDIESAAVIGVPDRRMGEVVCAYIIAAQDPQGGRCQIEPSDVIAWCRERIANFKVPRYISMLDVFPLTGSNKVSKVELRKLAASQRIGDAGGDSSAAG